MGEELRLDEAEIVKVAVIVGEGVGVPVLVCEDDIDPDGVDAPLEVLLIDGLGVSLNVRDALKQ